MLHQTPSAHLPPQECGGTSPPPCLPMLKFCATCPLFGIIPFIPVSPGSVDSLDQSTEGVCSSNLPAPFQASQYPNGGVL